MIFRREEPEDGEPLSSILHGKLLELSLPAYYETVSSSRIREYVDKDMDISMLVDPVAQSYIYEYGLYLRSPQFKEVLKPQERYYRRYSAATMPSELRYHAVGRESPRPWGSTAARTTGFSAGAAATSRDLRSSTRWWGTSRRPASSAATPPADSGAGTRYSAKGEDSAETCRQVVNELLARSLTDECTYALCRLKKPRPALTEALSQLGFVGIRGQEGLYYVDMRDPLVLIQDIFLSISRPHRDDPAVRQAVAESRPKLRSALTSLFPGSLVLTFDAETLNQALLHKVQQHNKNTRF